MIYSQVLGIKMETRQSVDAYRQACDIKAAAKLILNLLHHGHLGIIKINYWAESLSPTLQDIKS
jgi:hypothetical protein